MTTLTLRPASELTDDQFARFCQLNPDLQLERTAEGELMIMSPTGGETGRINAEIAFQLSHWNHQKNRGVVFDSSTGFQLPNGAIRSPDASWLSRERWEALTAFQKETFVPLCPDFVLELCSPTDTWEDLQTKMGEYLSNGLRLGWLIDPELGRVEIYRPEGVTEVLMKPKALSGERVLPGFVLDLENVLKT